MVKTKKFNFLLASLLLIILLTLAAYVYRVYDMNKVQEINGV
ncbi:hypothetical protein [Acinetobacter nematophilus]|uniref:Uncharacterized protein n=1 Tax=Acinetobacter nematophilus TaxID=2994642 RepID=A0A9X3DX73_9GAMM|nr:hypothetical protein [Acinetobacter nematophilus]MCX5470074.1 hypothetical protein [Acinetobacter nematophilus]